MSGASPDEAYEIRPFRTRDDYRACLELQDAVWGEEFSERVPLALLKVARRLGGIASGAFDADGELAGFVFGITGIEDGEPVHWSDMLAVRPGGRDRGLGTLLKRHQRERLLERGVERAYWTFDPLESRNAHLNFAKLGVVTREYRREMYGSETGSPLHRTIGTDRFVVLWRMASARVARRLAGGESPPGPGAFDEVPRANPPERRGDDLLPVPPVTDLSTPAVGVTIPADIQAVVRESPEKARAWRQQTRRAFRAYFSRGYEARELIREDGFSTYLLVRAEEGERAPASPESEPLRGESG